jgi:hypothetical protein
LGIVGLLIGYWLLQPVANRTLGWNLPTLVSIVNNDFSAPEKTPNVQPDKKPAANSSAKDGETAKPASQASQPKSEVGKVAKTEPAKSKTTDTTTSKKPSAKPKTAGVENTPSAKTKLSEPPVSNEGPTYGYLRSIGRDRYESPEGLVYAPGSEEGHRLRHVERHTEDIPDRPGSHGVFEGGMAQFLKTIDQGYRMAKSKAKGTTIREEDGMTVMEVTFDKKIGFVGGSTGRRNRTPSTKRLRIVLSGDRLITAFPY